jgi:hypothetical protein
MTTFKRHNIESAPEARLLEKSQKRFRNDSRSTWCFGWRSRDTWSYQTLHQSFVDLFRWRRINRCLANHQRWTWVSLIVYLHIQQLQEWWRWIHRMNGMPTDKLQVLREMTLKIVRNRGHVEQRFDTFYCRIRRKTSLEIILGLSQKY